MNRIKKIGLISMVLLCGCYHYAIKDNWEKDKMLVYTYVNRAIDSFDRADFSSANDFLQKALQLIPAHRIDIQRKLLTGQAVVLLFDDNFVEFQKVCHNLELLVSQERSLKEPAEALVLCIYKTNIGQTGEGIEFLEKNSQLKRSQLLRNFLLKGGE